MGEPPDLLGHDRETPTGFTSPGGFDASVQGQQVGLEDDLVDHPDDLRNLAGGLLDLAHRVDDHGLLILGAAALGLGHPALAIGVDPGALGLGLQARLRSRAIETIGTPKFAAFLVKKAAIQSAVFAARHRCGTPEGSC